MSCTAPGLLTEGDSSVVPLACAFKVWCPCLGRSEAETESSMSDSGVLKQHGAKGRAAVKQKKNRKKLKCEMWQC